MGLPPGKERNKTHTRVCLGIEGGGGGGGQKLSNSFIETTCDQAYFSLDREEKLHPASFIDISNNCSVDCA